MSKDTIKHTNKTKSKYAQFKNGHKSLKRL